MRTRIGCSGWSYTDWRGGLYPEGLPQRRWLARYAECFDTVEVNATFYRLPRRETVAEWARQTPPGFCFAIKASRYLTHVRRLRDTADGLERLRERIEPLIDAERLGPILWQLPATFRRDDDRLAAALGAMRWGRHVVEFRHPSWFAADALAVLREHGAGLAIGDDPQRPLPAAEPVGDLAYLRLHRGTRGRRGNYSPTELDAWAATVRRWARKAEVFVYLNNDWEGFAVANALGLRERLDRPGPVGRAGQTPPGEPGDPD